MTIGPMSVLSITGALRPSPLRSASRTPGFKAFFQRVSHCVISL